MNQTIELARGDLIWADFKVVPGEGAWSVARRPAMVVSPCGYNARSGLALVCPVTSAIIDYPFDVPIPDGLPMQGSVIADQVRSVDWRARNAVRVCAAPAQTVRDVSGLIVSILAGRA